MEKFAFKMQLLPGHADEYKRRHDAIWPDLQRLLHEAGISDYSIFLDAETNALFAVLRCSERRRMDALPQSELMQRWWRDMADIMVVRNDLAPVQQALHLMFHMD